MGNKNQPTNKTTSRLLEHCNNFRKAKFTGNLLPFDSLEIPEKEFLSRLLFKKINLNKDLDPHELFALICFEWGIMCPHPETKLTNFIFYSRCDACKTLVMHFDKKYFNPEENKNKTGDSLL